MKKYKQVMAALLAMNLTVYVMPTGVVKISAGVESQSNEDTTEETDTDSEEESNTEDNTEDNADNTEVAAATAETLEDAVGIEAEDTSATETLADAVGIETEAASATETLADAVSTEADVTSEAEVSDDTEAEIPSSDTSDSETEITDENIDDSTETPDVEVSDDTDAEISGEGQGADEVFSDGTQAEENITIKEDSAQAVGDEPIKPDGTIELNQLLNYNASTQTMTITSSQDLVLLSHCDQSKVQSINIEFSNSGDIDVTENNTNKITKGKDISAWFKNTSADSVNDQEQQTDTTASEIENIDADEAEIQESSDLDIEATEQNNGEESSVAEEQSGDTEVENSIEDDNTQNISVQSTITAPQDYTFQGIGNAESPYKGHISGEIKSVKIDHTFFGGLSSAATRPANWTLSVTWCGDGTVPMAADIYQFDSASDTGFTLPVKITGDVTSGTMGGLLGTVRESTKGTGHILNIGNAVTYGTTAGVTPTSGNAGFICNTLSGGTICIQSGYNYPTGNTQNKVKIQSADGNAGGLIGVMESGTSLRIETDLTFISDEITSESGSTDTNGNVGGLVGSVGENAEIHVGGSVGFTSLSITGTANAGGVAGVLQKNAVISMEGNGKVTLTSPDIKGSTSAGGVAGDAGNSTITGASESLEVDTPVVKGNKNISNVGGFIGHYKLAASDQNTEQGTSYTLPVCLKLSSPTVSATGRDDNTPTGSNAGGYFGYLELDGKWDCTFGNDADTQSTSFTSIHGKDTDRGRSYGAIAGKVTSTIIESTVKIQNMKIDSTYENQTVYHGGLIGELGTAGTKGNSVYLETSNVEIKVTNPFADGNKIGFGGLVGCLATGSILKVQNTTKVNTTGTTDPKIWEGGGIVGRAEQGSVLELSGITDLSGVNYVGNRFSVGWLVGYQDCALIYAKGDGNGNGWKYTRGTATSQFDTGKDIANDIANYGQVIRLKDEGEKSGSNLSRDLITINQNHTVTLKGLSLNENQGIILNSADDFALLSVAWNSRGYFSPDSNIGTSNWRSLKGKTIKLSKDIDLTGSGITGLSRDNNMSNDEDVYNGIFDGQGNTLTLAIGESFGTKKNEDTRLIGCGTVYGINNYHAALGIFAKTQGATIKNVTIAGNINLSNRGNCAIAAGGIAGFVVGTNTTKETIDEVIGKETIAADCYGADYNGQLKTSNMSVGGLYGEGGAGQLLLQNNTKASAKINLSTMRSNDSYVYAGEVLGQITADNFRLSVNGLTVGGDTADDGGSITTDATEYAYVGGLVGIIKPITKSDTPTNTIEENRWMEIRSLKFNNFTITANEATKACGGLFGSIWANVGVYFMGEIDTDEGTYAGKTKMTVENAAINAQKAAGVGGLAYRSSGIWEIRDKGIDMQKLSITADGDVGLLICRGEKGEEGEEKEAENVFDLGAVYVKLTKHWSDSYQLATDADSIKIRNNGAFDEFVAHTAANATEITYNGDNGVISLATEETSDDRKGVAENSPANCTTYQNRTAYGCNKKTNAYSRYYYDLDQCWSYLNKNRQKGQDNIIDDPRELMLWSVYRYASSNIKHFFIEAKNSNGNVDQANAFTDLKNCNTIGTNSGTAIFNMEKYSYYPIDISNSVTVQNSEIIFYNEQIENAEADNKSTQLKETAQPQTTQHYTMHCGLFLNQLKVKQNTKVTVDTVTFKGSIGKINSNGDSGVLFAGNVSGMADTQLYIAEVSLKGITFEGLKVNECGDGYAPLLINSIGSYTTLDANVIKTTGYTQQTAVASSLIGNVGSTDGKQINLSFLNITLPDMKAGGNNGIFSRATLLESFTHDGTSSVATYNFYMGDEWKDGTYTHNVTYGKEITESTEYIEKQLWYYDEENYGDSSNRVHKTADDLMTFSSAEYLPYVCKGFSEEEKSHEIKVNQRVADIIHGCGTYSHPYKITSEREMNILSEYMSTGTARTDWRVTITGNQSEYHKGTDTETIKYTYSGDKTYQFNGTEWVQVIKTEVDGKENWQSVKNTNGDEITLSREFMLQYLLNAYYDLQGSGEEKQLKLNNFGGFGISTRPFRGVITGSGGTTVVLSGTSTSNGLIPYSYGSVVKNLKISYQKSENNGKTLTYNGTKTSEYYPDECFGGVIGCVLGGDNIIDNVTVQMAEGWLTLAGEKAYLLQVGGYVGSISGGGVIFRDMPKNMGLINKEVNGITDIAGDCAHLYVNRYVGRVLDGFAFYETDDVTKYESSLENSDKNYKINTLNTSDTGSVTVELDNTVMVKDAQGLLVLSAIINSGAASGGTNNAYSSTTDNMTYSTNDKSATYNFAGKYGKVRNASYSSIKEDAPDNEKKLSSADDQTKPGNGSMPYLIQKYCNANTAIFNLCNTGAKIKLTTARSYDMTSYGSGYQGLGVRYISSASLNVNEVNTKGIIPEISSFDGDNSTILIDTEVKEYTDDDFKAASVGGLFNLLRVGSNQSGTVSKLVIAGKKERDTDPYSGVTVQYYNASGSTSTATNLNGIDAGAVAGAVSGLSASSGKTTGSVVFDDVTLENLTINGSVNAGGLLGSSKRTEKLEKNETGTALLFKNPQAVFSVGVTVRNSKYNNITVKAPNTAGGFVGYIDNDTNSSLVVTSTTSDWTGKDSKIGNDDNITTHAGGAFGYVKRTDGNVNSVLNINAGGTENYQNAVMQNIMISASECAGGFVGKIEGKVYQINKSTFTGNSSKAAVVSVNSADKCAGGIVGWAAGTTDNCNVQDCHVIWADVTEEDKKSNDEKGVKSGHGGIAGRIENAKVTVSACDVKKTSVTGGKAGGVIGNTAVATIIKNCEVEGADNKYEITGSETAGGIIGLSSASNAKIQMEQCKVYNMKMTSKSWGCGGMLGDVDWNAVLDTLYLFDCAVEKSEVYGSVSGATSGGFAGDIRGKLTAADLLLSEVKIHTTLKNKVGMVIGMADSRTGGIASEKQPGIVKVAGLSIQNVKAYYNDDEEKTVTQLYGVIADGTQKTTEENMKKYSYFAFADYSGTALTHQDSEADEKRTLLDDAKEISPYSVTSPVSSLAVYDEINSTTPELLYGDGASWDEKNALMAQTIWNSRNGSENGHYTYSNITDEKNAGYVSSFDFSTVFSTYNDNQSAKISTDFPVLQISGGDTTKVKDYLNILTNGAFSIASDTSNASVSAKAEVYSYNTEKQAFVKEADTKSPLQIEKKDGKITFSTTTDYDNDKNRFTLLTVTFTEKDIDENEHKYNVMVPVIVKRMLEVDFSATLSYGTNFRKENYDNLSAHVLESFGNSITGYLKYTYNSEKGSFKDYGWQSYINAGGNVADPLNKSIWFDQNEELPQGTQLSLVDCRNGKVYYYTVSGEEKKKIAFKNFVNSDGTAYEVPSIAELINAEVKKDSTGTFVKVEADGRPEGTEVSSDKTYAKPTVRIGTSYYRLANSDDTGDRYSIGVTEKSITEDFFLVITVPKDSTSASLNGILKTEIEKTVPNHITYMLINGKGDEGLDPQGNSPSTYVILKGYNQTLNESADVTALSQKMSSAASTMQVDVIDTITFPNKQVYQDTGIKDELYQRFVGSLQKTINGKTSAEQFPSGTTGEAQFYVYTELDGVRQYYTYKNGEWSLSGNSASVATRYTWTSDGGNMELPLADGTIDNIISLQGVRKLVKEAYQNSGSETSTFYVEVKMNASIPASGLNVIPESDDKTGEPTDYAKLVYSSQLSTVKESLAYSTNRVSYSDTRTKYYRDIPEGTKLTYEANQIGQLGINLLDLQHLDTSEEHSLIDTTALYDLSSMKNLDEALKNSEGIKFTLSLSPKKTAEELESYQKALSDANQYLSVDVQSPGSGDTVYSEGTWSWTVPKEKYWDDKTGKVTTSDIFNGTILTQAIQLKVNVSNVESSEHFYSNYKVDLRAEIVGSDNSSATDNIIYTLAKIKPEFQ